MGDSLGKASKHDYALHCYERALLFLEEDQMERTWDAAITLRNAGEASMKAGRSAEA